MDSSTSDVNLMDVSVDAAVGNSDPNVASLERMASSVGPGETPKRETGLNMGGGFMANSTFDESSQNDAESRVIRVGDEIMKVGSPNTSLGARAFLLQQGLQKQVEKALQQQEN